MDRFNRNVRNTGLGGIYSSLAGVSYTKSARSPGSSVNSETVHKIRPSEKPAENRGDYGAGSMISQRKRKNTSPSYQGQGKNKKKKTVVKKSKKKVVKRRVTSKKKIVRVGKGRVKKVNKKPRVKIADRF